jgi:hypothetical protein
LQELGDCEEVLRSPRDGQLYVILWGIGFAQDARDPKPPAIIAYERHGANGKRYVLTVMGLRPMNDREFDQLKLETP